MKTTLVLDYSKWRCGSNKENKLGEGDTNLLNKEGFMCCLGQFTPQLNHDVKYEDLLNIGTPAGITRNGKDIDVPFLTQIKKYPSESYWTTSTKLADDAININDNQDTTPDEKIEALKKLFAEYEIEITVINKPE